MTYSNQEKFVPNLNREPHFDPGDKVGTLVNEVNETFGPGHWNRPDKAGPIVDEMTGREINSARNAMRLEAARLRNRVKAIGAALEYMEERLNPKPDIRPVDYDDFD